MATWSKFTINQQKIVINKTYFKTTLPKSKTLAGS